MRCVKISTLILICSINVVFCQGTDNLNLATEFVKIIESTEGINSENIQSYLSIEPEKLKNDKDEINNIINMNLNSLHEVLNSCTDNYVITIHSLTNNELLKDYKYDYKELNSVFHVTCNRKIVTSIVIENHKIISFFTYLRKTGEEKIVPWILN